MKVFSRRKKKNGVTGEEGSSILMRFEGSCRSTTFFQCRRKMTRERWQKRTSDKGNEGTELIAGERRKRLEKCSLMQKTQS